MNIKIAVPVKDGEISRHFGESTGFLLVETADNSIVYHRLLEPPGHDSGVFPAFLINMKVDIVIATGIGIKAASLLRENGVEVITGVQEYNPGHAVAMYLKNELNPGLNPCDH